MGILYSQLFVKIPAPKESFKGKTVIVTGSNVGLGKEAARHIAHLGAEKIILAVRNTTAGKEAREDILTSIPHGNKSTIEVWPLDLANFESIQKFAEKARNLDKLDCLIENAGVAVRNFELVEGYERTIMVNVIGTFFLAISLLPILEKSTKEYNSRSLVSVVTSDVHAFAKFSQWKQVKIMDAFNQKEKYNMNQRYPVSKLLEVLIVRHLAKSFQDRGIILNMLNPGLCHSDLSRQGGTLLTVMKFLLARTTEEGSRTLVLAASAGPQSHGRYMNDGKIDDEKLSTFATSKDGVAASIKLWKELTVIYEEIQPGITKVLTTE